MNRFMFWKGAVGLLIVLLLRSAVLPAGQTEDPAVEGTAAPVERAEESIGDLLRERESNALPEKGTGPSITGTFLRMIGWTVAVLAVGGAVLLVLKKLTPAGRMLNANGMFHVLGRTLLSPRHTIYAVRISNQRLLIIGISGDRMVTLSEFSDATEMLACEGSFRSQLDAASIEDNTNDRAATQQQAVESRISGDLGEVGIDDDLQPYQREIQKLRQMIGGWKGAVSRHFGGRQREGVGVDENGREGWQ